MTNMQFLCAAVPIAVVAFLLGVGTLAVFAAMRDKSPRG